MRPGRNSPSTPAAIIGRTTPAHMAVSPPIRRHSRADSHSMANSSANGQRTSAARSAMPVPMSGLNSVISAAMGRSTMRDQCMTTGCAGASRVCVMSNQSCPSSQSRTCTSRIASSGPLTGLANPVCTQADVSSSATAQHQASAAAVAHGASFSRPRQAETGARAALSGFVSDMALSARVPLKQAIRATVAQARLRFGKGRRLRVAERVQI